MEPELLLAARSNSLATLQARFRPSRTAVALQGHPDGSIGRSQATPPARRRHQRSVLQFAVLGKRFERSNAHGVLHPIEELRFLLENGVDAKAKDSSGETAIDLAAASNYIEAVELLESGEYLQSLI